MRNYENIDKYLDQLGADIYAQPTDPGHIEWAFDAIKDVMENFHEEIDTVLDVGCGEGFCKPIFDRWNVKWFGVTLGGKDYKKAVGDYGDYVVTQGDISFLNHVKSNSIDLVFARHVLEHSPMPLLTLMEWYRVAKKYMLLIAPSSEYWDYWGKNHYAVMNKRQLWWLLSRSGWHIMGQWDFDTSDPLYMKYFMIENEPKDRVYHGPPDVVEHRYLCIKGVPKIE